MNSKILVDTELNITAKKIKKEPLIMGSGITVTNNEIKYFIKVICSLENRGILLKGTTKKIHSKTINFSWFSISEKCTHTIS